MGRDAELDRRPGFESTSRAGAKCRVTTALSLSSASSCSRQETLAATDNSPSATINNTAFIAIGRWSDFKVSIGGRNECLEQYFSS